MKKFTLLILLFSTLYSFAQPPSGNSLYFDGSNDYTSGPNIPLNSRSFSVSFWAKRDGSTGNHSFVMSQGEGAANYTLHIGFRPSGNFIFGFGSNDLETSATYNDEVWHNWTCTYNQPTMERTIYCDGDTVAYDVSSSDYLYSGTNELKLGRFFSFAYYFKGQVDDFAIWDSTLTDVEVNTLVSTSPTGSEENLLLFYNFNESACSDTLTDLTGLNTANLVNNPLWVNNSSLLSAPQNISFTDTTTSSVKINWEGPATGSATSYALQFDNDADFSSPIVNANAISNLYYNVTGLSTGSTYFCKIQAVNDDGVMSTCTHTFELRVAAPIADPASSLTDSSFVANWQAVAGAESYLLDVSTVPDFSSFVLQDFNVGLNTSYELTSLTEATAYYYRVKAVNSIFGNSWYSNTSYGITKTTPNGNSLYFHGKNSHANATDTLRLNSASFSVGVWTKTSSTESVEIIMAAGSNTENGHFKLFLVRNRLFFVLGGAYLGVSTASTINEWHYWVCTFDSVTKERNIYLDANLVASDVTDAYYDNTNGDIVLGSGVHSSYKNNTQLDDLSIWNKTLSADEVIALYGTQPIGTESNLVAYYNFDEDVCANSITDLANSNHIQIVEGTSWVNNQYNMALSNPMSISDKTDTSLTVNWQSPVIGSADYYSFLFDNNSDMSSPEVDSTGITALSYNINNLSYGSTYYMQVSTHNSDGIFANCIDSVIIEMGAPEGLSVSNISGTGFLATWNSSVLGETYLIDVSTQSDFSSFVYENYNVGADTSYYVSGLSQETNYYIRVKGVNESYGSSEYSNTDSLTTIFLPQGNSLSFNGSNYVAFDSVGTDTLSDITIECWVYPESTSYWQRIFDFGNGEHEYMMLSRNKNGSSYTPFFEMKANGVWQNLTSNSSVYNNEWTHMALVLEADEARMYMNGDLVGTNSSFTHNPADIGKTLNNYLAKSQFTADPNLVGKIDEFRIWNYARSQDSIQTKMDTTYSGNEEGLVAYYTFEASACADTLASQTANAYTGRLVNDPCWYSNEAGITAPSYFATTTIGATYFTTEWDTPAFGSAKNYTLIVDDNEDFSSPEFDSVGITSLSCKVTGLTFNTNYYCKLIANSINGSMASCVQVVETQMGVPVANNASAVTTTSFTANWNLVPEADKYLLDISNDEDFLSFVIQNQVVNNDTIYALTNALRGTNYYYRLRAVSAIYDTSTFSNVVALKTPMLPDSTSVYLNGSNQYASVSDSIDLSSKSFSISLFAKRSSYNRDDYIVGQGNASTNQGLHIGYRSDNTFTFAFFSNDLNTPSQRSDREWHHWACVYNSTTKVREIYRDGVVVVSDVATSDYLFNGSGELTIGRIPFWNYYYYGLLDEVAIWDTALNSAQVDSIMKIPPSGSEKGLLAYYNFNENSCTDTLTDLAAMHTAELVNNPVRTVNSSALSTPNVYTSYLTSHSFRLNWENPDYGSAASYCVQIDNNEDFSSPEYHLLNTTQNYIDVKNIEQNTVYHCRVKAVNADGLESYYTCPISLESEDGPVFSFGNIISSVADGVESIFVTDIDGDGDNDVLAASKYGSEVAWYENTDGFGNFGPNNQISSSVSSPNAVYAADMDGDGDMDVLSASSNDDKIAWYENTDGLGTFGDQQIISTLADNAYDVKAVDLDGDGDMDVLSASYYDDEIAWYENTDGLGTFGEQQIITSIVDGACKVETADIDGDGDMDVLSASAYDDEIAWYENTDGLGTFGEQQIITNLVNYAIDVKAADVDGDGDMDVLSASVYDDEIAWYENTDGLGTFGQQQVIITHGDQPHSIAVSDIDMDGDVDILVGCSYSYDFFWLENSNGLGAFDYQLINKETDYNYTRSVAIADMNGDGTPDLLNSNYSYDKITWFENSGIYITEEPVAQVSCPNSVLNFSVHASGAESYQWQMKDSSGYSNLANDSIYSGVQSSSLQVYAPMALNESVYRCVLSNKAGIRILLTPDTLFIEDVEAPMLEAKDVQLALNSIGEATLSVNDVLVSATDNCSLSDTVLSQTLFTSADVGSVIDVEVRVIDAIGNETSQSIQVTVIDTLKPELVLKNAMLEFNENGVANLQLSDVLVSATDNVALADTSFSQTEFDCSAIGDTLAVEVILSDVSGNTITEIALLTFIDNIIPVANAESLETLMAECSLEMPIVPMATDNCFSQVTGTTLTQFPITEQCDSVITWIFEDASGNVSTQTQRVLISDQTAPIADVESLTDISAECEVTNLVAPKATDNCSGSVMVSHNATLPITTQGTTEVVWTYTDANGNISTQKQSIVIADVSLPVLICSGIYSADIAEGETLYVVESDEFDPLLVDDNCEISSITNSINNSESLANAEFSEGKTTVVWTVTDIAGNTSECTSELWINGYVGIDRSINSDITVYPNPTSGILNVQIGQEKIELLQVIDLKGQVVYSTTEVEQQQQIDFSNFESGIYIISIQTTNKLIKQKVVKE